MKRMILAVIALSLTFVIGCKKENNEDPVDLGWSGHLLVVNEGAYPTGSGSISAYDREKGMVTKDLFKTVNGYPLGNIVQTITLHGDRFYIVVNNANRVEVVDKNSFVSTGSYTEVSFPHSFLGISPSKGYLSCWDNSVKVLNLEDYSVEKSIEVGAGPEKMVMAEYLWVINGGGFGVDSTISIIDTEADTVKMTVMTGHVPSGMVKDGAGNIWVLCSGKGWNGFPAADDTPGKLICYQSNTAEVLKEFDFPTSDLHPDNLVINTSQQVLYYNHPQGIFAYSIGSDELPSSPLVQGQGQFYGIGYDPVSDVVLGADPKDYVQEGWAYFFDPIGGTKVDSIKTGVIPNGFWAGN